MPEPDDHPLAKPDAVLPPESGAQAEGAPADPFAAVGGLGGLGGPGGGLDLGSLLDMAGQMQQQMAQAQAAAEAATFEGVAGGDVVKITVTGGGEFTSVVIDPEVVDPADVEMLQDLVLAALHDAMAQVHEAQESTGGAALGALPDLGSLGDLFGGAG